ncbi:MAG: DNA translocase FtsK [Methanobrevibacter sp.]|nr:DNA translocase FtsK [Methanobrevibacter sp.]
MKRKFINPSGQIYTLFDDMTKQPHLLIAGATGSGKSVIVNGIISTLLYKFPNEAQFILIDPKRVELSPYKRLPHTLFYASEPQEMVNALRYAMQIVNTRYAQMQKRGERKYSGGDVYVIIDEWADLMTTNRRQVAPIVQRLAQVGRASKVHVILCTQTPIAKVIPTEIKCNFDSRVGLRTRSAQDSRNILGYTGLEALPMYGEGIYLTPHGETKYKIPYVNEDEQKRLITWWTNQNKKSWIERLFA